MSNNGSAPRQGRNSETRKRVGNDAHSPKPPAKVSKQKKETKQSQNQNPIPGSNISFSALQDHGAGNNQRGRTVDTNAPAHHGKQNKTGAIPFRGGRGGRGGFNRGRGGRGRGRGQGGSRSSSANFRGRSQLTTYQYYNIIPMEPEPKPLQYKRITGTEMTVVLKYDTTNTNFNELIQSSQNILGYVNSILYTDAIATTGNNVKHFSNVSTISVVVMNDFVDDDGNIIRKGQPVRVRINQTFLSETSMMCKVQIGPNNPVEITGDSSAKEKALYTKLYKNAVGKIMPGDFVHLMPQKRKINQSNNQAYKLWQVNVAHRHAKIVDPPETEWSEMPRDLCFTVVGQSTTASRFTAVTHGCIKNENTLKEPATWSNPGCVPVLIKSTLGYIPNAGTKMVVDENLQVYPTRPFKSKGTPSIAQSAANSADGDPRHHQEDDELAKLPDKFDFDVPKPLGDPDAIRQPLEDLRLRVQPRLTPAKQQELPAGAANFMMETIQSSSPMRK